MTKKIVECIANYSEARRPEVVEQIARAIEDVPGAHLLDRHSDEDHNRTVLTFAGAPEAIEQAATLSIARAAELIDMEQHSGEHPRIGATDVVPFVPITGVTMQDCVDIARRVGQRVGDELDIPVYLYEEAAVKPERKFLENIRKGEYETLKSEMGTNPEREPDFGPARIGSAGATVIGARQPLIAFNVYLNTDDVGVANKIARAVRRSSGGLRYVKAMGMLVEGKAQVSMNLTNFHGTPLARVVETIRREAKRYGVVVGSSELVGLIPNEALVDAAIWYLQLDQFNPQQILEKRLDVALKRAQDTEPYLDERFLQTLSAGTATPGGGSAAAYSGAAGAALVAMVARLTIGKKKYTAVENQMKEILGQAEELRKKLTSAVQEDAAAFEGVMAAFRLPKNDAREREERLEAIQEATILAAKVPLKVAAMAVDVIGLASQVVEKGNLNAISDGGTAAALAKASLTGAGYNVHINVDGLRDEKIGGELLTKLETLERNAHTLQGKIRSSMTERGGLPLE